MTEERFFSLLTATGEARLSNALALGRTVAITELAVGDGENGAYYTPTEAQGALKNEVYRGAVNNKYVHARNANWAVFELAVPASEGPWTVREAGVFDDAGNMIAVAKLPETYKPALKQGSGKDLLIKFILQTSNAAQLELLIDPGVVLATHDKVASDIAGHNGDPGAHPNLAAARATETVEGTVELATVAEAKAGADAVRAVTPAGLGAALAGGRKQLLMNSLLDAMAGGAALRVLDGGADPFADADKIDAGASGGYTHDADGDFVHNPPAAAGYGPNLITGAETYTASTFLRGHEPGKAADGSLKTHWSCANGISQWWKVQFGEPVTVRKYRFYYVLHELAAVTFEGSNDDVNWTRLDRVSLTPRSGRGWIERTFANETGYLYYGLTQMMSRSSDNSGAFSIEMFEALPPKPAPHMTLVSTAIEAFVAPAAGYLLGVVEPVDAVAYGVDVLADLSRDDGKTWEALTLAKAGVTEDGHDVVFGEVRFAAAAGRAVRSRWRTRNNKHVKLHGSILDAEA